MRRRCARDLTCCISLLYSDDICHGRRIPEDTLRGIYREIKLHPIAPPVVSLTGVPLQVPAVTGSPTKENVDCAVALAGRGEPLTSLDFLDLVRLRTADLGSGPSAREAQAAAVFAALPEVWHACTRVGLSTFARVFEEPAVDGPADAAAPAVYAQSSTVPLPQTSVGVSGSAARQYAWEQLDVLVSCAQVAQGLGMHSGSDIVVAALCKVAGASLRAVCPDFAPPFVAGVAAASSGSPSQQDNPQQFLDETALAAFVVDSRAHMALAAALWLASQHSDALSTASWQCVLDCLFRLQRAGLLDLGAQPRRRTAAAQGDAPSVSTVDADGDAALQHLLQAYASAVVKLGRLRRQNRAAAALSLAEAMVLGTPPASGATLATSSVGVGSAVLPASISGSEDPGEEPTSTTPGAEHPTLDSGSSVSALLSWLFGSETGGAAVAQGVVERSTPGSSTDPTLVSDAIASSEWAALQGEEPDDELALRRVEGTGLPLRLEGTLAKLTSAAQGLWSDLVDLNDEAASRVLAALVKLAGLPCPLALDVVGAGRGLQQRASDVSTNPCATPQRGAATALSAVATFGDGVSHDAGTFDDGAAFIGTMESARFKCTQLMPPPEPRVGSYLSRLVLRGLGLVAQCGIQHWSERLSCTALVVSRHALECVLAETSAVTRRVRTTLAAVAAPCVSALLVPVGADDPPATVLGEAVGLLFQLCTLPVPAAGAARLQVSWMFSSRVKPRATPQLRRLWALPLPADVAPASVHGLLSSAASETAAFDGEAPRPDTLSAGRALEATLAACGLPSWEADDAASPPVETASVSDSFRTGPSLGSATADGEPSSRSLPLEAGGALSHDELHALELVSATSARAALGFVSVWAADEVISACHDEASRTPGHAIEETAALAVLDALAVFIHRPLPTSTITVDDLGVDAVDALGVTLLLRGTSQATSDAMSASPGADEGSAAADCLPTIFVRGLHLLAATVSDQRLGVRLHALHTLRQVGLRVRSEPRSSAAVDDFPAVWQVVARKVLVPLLGACITLWGDAPLPPQPPRSGDPCVHTVIATIASVAELCSHAGPALLYPGCAAEDASAFVEVLEALHSSLLRASPTVVTAVQPAVEACLGRATEWIGSQAAIPGTSSGPLQAVCTSLQTVLVGVRSDK